MLIPENITGFVLLTIFILTWAVQLFYYLFYYRRIATHRKPDDRKVKLPPVSVVICARDEEANLTNFLPSFLEQDYPNFEVIVVNDCSEDNTQTVLEELAKQYPNLRISVIKKDPVFKHGKKMAMLVGIKAANNEHLVFSDADCQPESTVWLAEMAAGFGEKNKIILGYGGYLKESSLLNSYIRYDTFFSGMQFLGMALAGRPYMGVGRNLAYLKSFFFEKRGFSTHYHLRSGDDDLFVNGNAESDTTSVVASPGAITRSVPAGTFGSWIRQKQRHSSTFSFYKSRDKILLFLEPFSRIVYYTTLIWLIALLTSIPVVAGLALIRLVIRTVIYSKVSRLLNEKSIVVYSIIFDIFSPLLNSIVYFSSKIKGGERKDLWS